MITDTARNGRSAICYAHLYHADCFDIMPKIESKSIDLILADLPYGTTESKWDSILPLGKLWTEYKRVLKPNGIVILTSSEPFTSVLNVSNLDWFKYDFIWNKLNATGHLNAKARPLKQHENISIFSEGSATSTSLTMCYNPQGLFDVDITKVNFETETTGKRQSRAKGKEWKQTKSGYPKTILNFAYDKEKFHPTQKPVELLKYLIKTYTNKGMTILDNTMGSGSTGVSAKMLQRNFIGIEKELNYFEIAQKRIDNTIIETSIFDCA
jgi:site-specific DNA-methyltransferase (adenine-specific)